MYMLSAEEIELKQKVPISDICSKKYMFQIFLIIQSIREKNSVININRSIMISSASN